jgi:hypothetical protein
VVWALAALSGCASAQAKSSAEKLPLDVPSPPPHDIELPAQPLEPVGEIPSPTDPGASRPRPPAAKPPETKPEKPDTPPAQPAIPAETPAPALPPPAPAPQLRTPETADTSAAAKVHATIDHAKSLLNNSVNFQLLNNERKKAYNDVKQYCDQAEDALKEGNIVYAQAVATKAEKLALELAGR